MNKKQRLQIQQAKQARPITYQEAWNKISEFMHKDGGVCYFTESFSMEPCKLYTQHDYKQKICFSQTNFKKGCN